MRFLLVSKISNQNHKILDRSKIFNFSLIVAVLSILFSYIVYFM